MDTSPHCVADYSWIGGIGRLSIKIFTDLYCNQIRTGKLKESVRILQITDLHNSMFGDDNAKLLNLVAEQAPDLILIFMKVVS